jgi:hypothetical protein
LTRQGEILPNFCTGSGNIELNHLCRLVARDEVSPSAFFLGPCAIQIAYPAIDIAESTARERRDDPPPYKVVPDSELPVVGQAHLYGQEFPMKRFCGFPPTPEFTGDLEEMSLLAGESVGQTNRLMSAASIIDEMIRGAEAVIRKRLGSMVVD